MKVESVLALMVSLLSLATTCYPDKYDYVNKIFGLAADKLQEYKDGK